MDSEDAHMTSPSEDEQLEDWPVTSSAPTTPSRRGGVSVASSDYEPDYDDNDYLPEPDAGEPSQGFATQTAFDAYFLHASKPARTSSNVFSQLVPPLTPEEHAAALAKVHEREQGQRRALWRDAGARRTWFRRLRMELEEGFNVLLYGCGSKREFLNAFAQDLSRRGNENHVVVANGFNPAFAFKDLLATIEQIPGVLDHHPSASGEPGAGAGGGGQEAQTQRIHAFFSARDAPHLYLVAHNVDGNAFRAPKHRAALALLALAPHVHVVASVDHVAAPARWSLAEIFARKPDPPSGGSAPPDGDSEVVPRRGFAWLWHDLTTLAPYDFELAYADPTALAGVAALRGTRAPTASAAVLAAAGAGAGGQAAIVTETAARHVLASVTVKAKKLFVLLGSKQLEVMDAPAGDKGKQDIGAEGEKEKEGAYDYDRLFAAARDNFVATNDTALRALLGEFKDHGLVVTVATGAEAMWIPMRREALLKIVGELKAEGH
uniref:Origin recognition complex subunit 2 n=1 Tax=Ganoderma boninense TaxID=34458 RepID=A0A5K1K2N7_9APHY|nr:ABC transporter [Ganoderma boninense]